MGKYLGLVFILLLGPSELRAAEASPAQKNCPGIFARFFKSSAEKEATAPEEALEQIPLSKDDSVHFNLKSHDFSYPPDYRLRLNEVDELIAFYKVNGAKKYYDDIVAARDAYLKQLHNGGDPDGKAFKTMLSHIHQSVWHDYSWFGFGTANRALYSANAKELKKNAPYIRALLSGLLDTSTASARTTNRWVWLNDPNAIESYVQAAKNGATRKEPAFVSTTMNNSNHFNYASHPSGASGVEVKFQFYGAPKAIPIHVGQEAEYLYPPGTRFHVESVTKTPSGTYEVALSQEGYTGKDLLTNANMALPESVLNHLGSMVPKTRSFDQLSYSFPYRNIINLSLNLQTKTLSVTVSYTTLTAAQERLMAMARSLHLQVSSSKEGHEIRSSDPQAIAGFLSALEKMNY